ncbi:MAG: hypothetical protein CMJ58_14215 [Planctomycetaceae bacterium]|nr:hypothetical protein [Planctomycetaceae bacterium]
MPNPMLLLRAAVSLFADGRWRLTGQCFAFTTLTQQAMTMPVRLSITMPMSTSVSMSITMTTFRPDVGR